MAASGIKCNHLILEGTIHVVYTMNSIDVVEINFAYIGMLLL